MNPLNDIISNLYDVMSNAQALDPEELIPGDIRDALDTLADHGTNLDASEIVVGGDHIQSHIDALVSAIDEAYATAQSIAHELGI